jgi:haloacetate dehalogenase
VPLATGAARGRLIGPFFRLASEWRAYLPNDGADMFESFEEFTVDVGDGVVAGRVSACPSRRGHSRRALLLLHGHPQTHVMWHKVADRLADDFVVIAPDLPGYGRSIARRDGIAHPFSKRAIADQIVVAINALAGQFQFDGIVVCAHDRGARVAHRLCLDHSDIVGAAMFLDIAPTVDMYAMTNREFATAYWHWFFLIQPEPLPERLIGADPDAYLEGVLGSRFAGMAPFTDQALNAYRTALHNPAVIHAICEDYRASAGIDITEDLASRTSGELISVPLRVLWGHHGTVGEHFEPLALWGRVARTVDGRALDCGHYIAEERPDELVDEIHDFLSPARAKTDHR